MRRYSSIEAIQLAWDIRGSTFMKTAVGGALLVSCFLNGKNEIQIIGVGRLSVENEDNWIWF